MNPYGRPKTDPVIRFWRRVNKNGPIPKHVPHLGNCWVWTGFKFPDGYGVLGFSIRDVSVGYKRAHRFSWEIHRGRIPYKMWVLHKCDTPLCVRPDHLFLGTPKDNSNDMVNKKRSPHNRMIGEKCGLSKMTDKTVVTARALKRRGWTNARIAQRYGVDPSTISFIISRKTWTHL